jgi:hypothetical protein
MLVKKLKNAHRGLKGCRDAYIGLTESLEPDELEKWRADERRAMVDRGPALEIFHVSTEKASTAAEIKLTLMSNKSKMGLESGMVAWLATGISIEAAQ